MNTSTIDRGELIRDQVRARYGRIAGRPVRMLDIVSPPVGHKGVRGPDFLDLYAPGEAAQVPVEALQPLLDAAIRRRWPSWPRARRCWTSAPAAASTSCSRPARRTDRQGLRPGHDRPDAGAGAREPGAHWLTNVSSSRARSSTSRCPTTASTSSSRTA